MNKKEIIDLIARRKQNSEMMMNSGNRRDIFIPGHCTFEQTGYTMVNHNRYYRCRTCMNNSGINFCFCEECAKVCHKGHDVTQSGSGPAFCDCGAGHFLFPCMLMHRHNEEKEKKDETEKA